MPMRNTADFSLSEISVTSVAAGAVSASVRDQKHVLWRRFCFVQLCVVVAW